MKELMELRQLAQQIDNQEAVSLYNKVDKEIERLNNVINKALHKLRASKDHFKTERENNTIVFVIRILESDKE